MFKVYDKDAGTYVDLREIMDFPEEEYKENLQVSQILKQINETNPVHQIQVP
jgi:Ca2+-binding EF-hand superfamily protein